MIIDALRLYCHLMGITYLIESVVPSSDHYIIESVVSSTDHCCTEIVLPFSELYIFD